MYKQINKKIFESLIICFMPIAFRKKKNVRNFLRIQVENV